MDSTTPHEEIQYIQLIQKILKDGSMETGRNGNVKSIFGNMMRFSLQDGTIPFLTTKKLAWKTCFYELQWFLRGCTDNHELQKQNVHIWDANATKEFLQTRELDYMVEGDLGPIYGWQWRHWGANYTGCHTDYTNQGIDQLQSIIDTLKNPALRSSRRMILSAWNVGDIDKMALPPCHCFVQFHVKENRFLSCSLYQRSGDIGLGVGFNIASYSFLTHILARHCGLEAYEFVYFLGDCHIYEQHIESLQTQIERVPFPFPKIRIKECYNSIEEYSIDDIEFIETYQCHPPIKMDMIA
jgi:thymidylate synthase